MSEKLVFELVAVNRATEPLRKVQADVKRVAASINASTATMRTNTATVNLANRDMQRWAKGALQQAGYQVGDFAVQVANGTSAVQAFGQQGSQLLGIFGPVGAVLGAALAIVSAIGVAAEKSGKQVSDLGSVLGVLREPVVMLGDALSSLQGMFGSVFPFIVRNIDTAIIAAGLFGTVMVAKMIPSLIASSGASVLAGRAMITFRAGLLAATLDAGRFSIVMTTVRAAVLTLGAGLRVVMALFMRFLPIAVILLLAKFIEMVLAAKKAVGSWGGVLELLKNIALEIFDRMKTGVIMVGSAFNTAAQAIKYAFGLAFQYVLEKFVAMTGTISDGLNKLFEFANLDIRAKPLGADFLKDFNDGLAETETAMNDAATNTRKLAGAMVAPLESWGKFKEAVAAGTEEVNVFGAKAAETTDKTGGTIDKLKNKFDSLRESISNSMEDAFMSMVDGTKSVGDAFKSMASSIIKELFRVLVVQRMVNSIMGVVTSIFPSLAPVPAIAGARASGGTVTGGRPYLVGEKGPEIVVPGRTGTVVPNGASMGGGVVVNQSITFGSGVTRSEVNAMIPKIIEATKAAVADASRRGGSYGSSFA